MEQPENPTPKPQSTIFLHPVGTVHNAITDPSLIAGKDGLSMQVRHDIMVERIRRTEIEISHIVIQKTWRISSPASRSTPTWSCSIGRMPFPRNTGP